MKQKTASKKMEKITPVSCAEKEEQIRKKAYEFYEKRGCQHGFDQEDWLHAEKEVCK